MALDAKVAHVTHELHSIRKGDRSIVEYLAHVKCLVDVLSTSGYEVSEIVYRQFVLIGLSVEFESVITLATYSPVPMTMKQLVKALLEYEL